MRNMLEPPVQITKTTETLKKLLRESPSLHRCEPPFGKSYGTGGFQNTRKCLIVWWAVQGSNLRPPD
jgi:hypothetical protein